VKVAMVMVKVCGQQARPATRRKVKDKAAAAVRRKVKYGRQAAGAAGSALGRCCGSRQAA